MKWVTVSWIPQVLWSAISSGLHYFF